MDDAIAPTVLDSIEFSRVQRCVHTMTVTSE
jgi:hypothetical protein